MKSPGDDRKFQFRLEDIMVVNCTTVLHPVISIDSGLASIEFGFNFTFNTKEDIAICKILIRYLIAADLPDQTNGTKSVFTIDVDYFFNVQDLEKFVQTIDGKQHLETGVMINLLSVAYSTTRGIVYERTRGYGINKLHLLVINMEDYISKLRADNEASESNSSTQSS